MKFADIELRTGRLGKIVRGTRAMLVESTTYADAALSCVRDHEAVFYRNPNGTQIEPQVDDFESHAYRQAFFESKVPAANTVDVEFDREKPGRPLRASESDALINQYCTIVPRSLNGVPLQ